MASLKTMISEEAFSTASGKRKVSILFRVCVDYTGLKEQALDRLAEMVREYLDIEFIERMLKL